MTPSCSIYNPPNLRSRYTKLSRELMLTNSFSMKIANLYNVCISQLCHSMIFSMRKYLFVNLHRRSALIHAITSIICIRAKPKMCRIYTRWVIAGVQNIKTKWYWPIRKFIRKTVY